MDANWLIAFGVILVLSNLVTWLALARRYNGKVAEHRSLSEAISKARTEGTNVAEALGKAKQQLSAVEGRTTELVALEGRANEIRDLLQNGRSRLEQLKSQITSKKEEIEEIERESHQLKADLDLYTRIADFVDYGLFEEPEYLHETSERYKVEIKRVREEQKKLIKEKLAVDLPDDIEVDGTSQKGSSVLAGQAKMMLRAFNIECDLLIEKVSPSNLDRTLERIDKCAEALEKSAISLMCGISTDYVKSKFEECRLQYEHKLRKEAEQEEQRLIREQMREEQKAIKEYERALAEAEKEERMYKKMLDGVRKEMNEAEGTARAELEAQIKALEQQLHDAEEKEERAKSLAEQTRRGHIYVISNVGSFGEDVYKIGLTRRLDPMERVKELGDASVPFKFDVHAVIFSDDAPAMESTLHRKFNHARVNAVNRRKEFFRVSLDDIKLAVEDVHDGETEFKMTALAEEYYESLRLLGSQLEGAASNSAT